MGARVVVVLLLAMVASACAASQVEDWACPNPEHGDYFMEELFGTPAAALASVDNEPAPYRPTDTDTGRGYVTRDQGGAIERLVELQSQDGQWGVVSVRSCTGFG